MKKYLRKLDRLTLARLAKETGAIGVPTPAHSDKELVDAIAAWAAGYSLNWWDFVARFPYLGGDIEI